MPRRECLMLGRSQHPSDEWFIGLVSAIVTDRAWHRTCVGGSSGYIQGFGRCPRQRGCVGSRWPAACATWFQ